MDSKGLQSTREQFVHRYRSTLWWAIARLVLLFFLVACGWIHNRWGEIAIALVLLSMLSPWLPGSEPTPVQLRNVFWIRRFGEGRDRVARFHLSLESAVVQLGYRLVVLSDSAVSGIAETHYLMRWKVMVGIAVCFGVLGYVASDTDVHWAEVLVLSLSPSLLLLGKRILSRPMKVSPQHSNRFNNELERLSQDRTTRASILFQCPTDGEYWQEVFSAGIVRADAAILLAADIDSHGLTPGLQFEIGEIARILGPERLIVIYPDRVSSARSHLPPGHQEIVCTDTMMFQIWPWQRELSYLHFDLSKALRAAKDAAVRDYQPRLKPSRSTVSFSCRAWIVAMVAGFLYLPLAECVGVFVSFLIGKACELGDRSFWPMISGDSWWRWHGLPLGVAASLVTTRAILRSSPLTRLWFTNTIFTLLCFSFVMVFPLGQAEPCNPTTLSLASCALCLFSMGVMDVQKSMNLSGHFEQIMFLSSQFLLWSLGAIAPFCTAVLIMLGQGDNPILYRRELAPNLITVGAAIVGGVLTACDFWNALRRPAP